MPNCEDEPFRESAISPLLKQRYERFTATGWLWLFLPWMLILRKRLRCSLLELMIFMVALGSSIGVIVRALINIPGVEPAVVIFSLIALHAHLLGLSAALYERRFLVRTPSQVRCVLSIVWYLLLPTVLSHLLAAMIRPGK